MAHGLQQRSKVIKKVMVADPYVTLAGKVKGSCKMEIQAAMGGLGCPGSRVPLPCYRGDRKAVLPATKLAAGSLPGPWLPAGA